MTRRGKAAWFASVALIAALGIAWLSQHRAPAVTEPAEAVPSASTEPRVGVRAAPSPITLPVYAPDPRPLPGVDTPLRDSRAVLQAAAERGNVTAACRLAFVAMDCWEYALRGSTDSAEAAARHVEAVYADGNSEVTALVARRITEAPPPLRDYVRDRVDAIEMARASEGDAIRAQAQRCEGAPRVGSGEVARLLRQAALAGQPDAVVAYAHGAWITSILGMDAARTPDQPATPLDVLRDPSFLVWRREAMAIHQAGLEAGLIQVIETEAMPNRMTTMDLVVQRDRVQQAAAVRALAAIVGHGAPPSTATLGLDAMQAAEADRRADRWVAAARERSTTTDPRRVVVNTMDMAGRLPTCE